LTGLNEYQQPASHPTLHPTYMFMNVCESEMRIEYVYIYNTVYTRDFQRTVITRHSAF